MKIYLKEIHYSIFIIKTYGEFENNPLPSESIK